MSIQYSISSPIVLGPLIVLILLALLLHVRVSKTRYTVRHYVSMLAFAIYMLGVMHFVFFPIDVNIGIYANQTPWYQSIQWIPLLTADAPSFLLNIVLFMPLGFMLPFIKPWIHSMQTAALAGLALSILIEITQLLLRVTLGNGRSTDLNDIIANTTGSVLGIVILNLFTKSSIGQRLMTLWESPQGVSSKDIQ
ncbi:glycopeptide antibiotics resistance protein [Paenibacillus sp. W4I10]|uniref:VanZ family protein n=1 Tax=Paenibacillus sp. W4I10 TaxID=3042298 RepID=UPI00277F30BF|nr:VanZ family protein [Paenibacillus sp. W4I10]MDQ0723199.1 glycopeptide antibiotics resistance protein [Paenibacillus sp. W4I10]